MRCHQVPNALLLLSFVCIPAITTRASVTLRLLPDTSPYNVALGVTDGGTYIIGYGQAPNSPARTVRWDAAGYVTPIQPDTTTTPTGMSRDGSVISGVFRYQSGYRALRWTSVDGYTALNALPGFTYSYVHGVSADGLYVLGSSTFSTGGGSPTAWDAAGVPHSLSPPSGMIQGTLYDAADGGVLFSGTSYDGTHQHASFWSAPSISATLLPVPASYLQSSAVGVSADGSIITGSIYNAGSDGQPVFWDSSRSIHTLPLLPGTNFGSAWDVSDDGSIIIGNCWAALNSGPFRPALWINGQLIELRALLISNGVPSSLASSLQLTSISSDGNYLTGICTSGGIDHGCLIQIPAPGMYGTVFIAGLISTRRRRSGSR